MAIAVGQQVSNPASGSNLSNTTATTQTVSITPSAGSTLVVLTRGQGGSNAVSVADNVNAGGYTALDSYTDSNANWATFIKQNVAASATTVTGTWASTNANRGIIVIEITGATTSGGAQAHTFSAADGLSSGNMTVGTAPSLVIGFACNESGATQVLGSGFTTGTKCWNSSGDPCLPEYKTVSSTGSYDVNVTGGSANMPVFAIAVTQASSGVSVALTGLSATASRGTPVAAIATPVTGQSATTSLGTLSLPGASAALTGQSATASGGTLTPSIGVPLAGRALTSARGTIVPAMAAPLTGQAATSGQGTLFVAAPSVAPIWQALITEGTGTAIGDTAAGTAVNLTLGGSTGWTSNTGGVGYNFGNNATLAAANTSLSGTKLQTAFAGATKCSIEFEANLASFITGNVLLYLGNNAVTGAVFLISCDSAGGIIITSADGAYEFTATTGLHVYLIEIDSTLAVGSRIKAKVDGTVKTMIVNTEMTSGAALDVNCSTWSSNRLTMGGTNGSDSLNGSVFYAAIYAITGAVDHTAALIANNDAAPSNNIIVALTGIAVAISRGLLAAATAVGLTGQSSTSSQGTVSQGTGQALTGQQLTTSGGTLGVNVSRAITGIGASATQGTQSAAVAIPLTGQSATSAKGFLAPPNTVFAALTGLFATASAGALRPSIGVSLTGRSVATSIGTTVGAIARSLTGAALSAIGGLFTPVTPVSQRKFLATSLVSADVSLSLVSSDQSRTLVEG